MLEIWQQFIDGLAGFRTGHAWASLGTLALLELVLGIDNVVFLAIIVGKLPPQK
jgi:predicted tellurium resistance membrane protein TerC